VISGVIHQALVQDVAVDKGKTGMVVRPGQVIPVAGISQRIQGNNAVLWSLPGSGFPYCRYWGVGYWGTGVDYKGQ
jgi:hypothetical protein